MMVLFLISCKAVSSPTDIKQNMQLDFEGLGIILRVGDDIHNMQLPKIEKKIFISRRTHPLLYTQAVEP